MLDAKIRGNLQALADHVAGENDDLCVVGMAVLVDLLRDDIVSTVDSRQL